MNIQQASELGAKSHDLGHAIARALAETPDQRAFKHRGAQITRGALLEAMKKTADDLMAVGLSAGEPVAIEIEHCIALPIAMGGILLAGGCVVPLEPKLAEDRRAAIHSDISPRILLTASGANIDIQYGADPDTVRTFDPNLAFVVYTSGSTGGPKGVEISHTNYVSRLNAIVQMSFASNKDVDLAWTPSSFIGMLDEFFYPLLAGIPAVIASPNTRTNPRTLAELIEREGITTFRATPSLLKLLLRPDLAAKLQGVRAIYCSGETLPVELQSLSHQLLPASLLGFYGATEAPGVGYHLYDRNSEPLQTTVCTPQSFADLRVTLPDYTAAKVGEPGEVWIGGCATALGYWRKPDLTKSKFVSLEGTRWYRSGDIGVQLADGAIEILGRADTTEVNLNGARVNLPEICQAMRNKAGVTDAWVSTAKTTNGDLALVGHYVAPDTVPSDELSNHLVRSLSPHSVPRHFMYHTSFPLTANGKLDAQSLCQAAEEKLASARTVVVKEKDFVDVTLLSNVLDVAQEILQTRGLTADDNFFAVGGTSLFAVQFALALSDRLGVEMSSTLIFNTDTFGNVAEVIASGRGHAAAALKLLRKGTGDSNPIFTVNSTGNYIALCEHLAPELDIYNANIFGLTNDMGDALDSYSLEDIAARLADQIVGAKANGPWRLMAYCQDGCLAAEIARNLQARSESTCSLLLIDTFFTDHRATLSMKLRRMRDLRPADLLQKLGHKFGRKRPGKAKATPAARLAALKQKTHRDKRLYARFTQHFMTYAPEPIEAPVTLCISREWRNANLSSVRHLAGPSLEIRHIEGLHNSLFQPQAIRGLATAMNDAIADLSSRGL